MSFSPRVTKRLQANVLGWWGTTSRDFPWRQTRDPWLIHVSEVMSQQTQVERVVPKWRAFIDRFPSPATAAEATPGDVILLWDGLGYNRRALLLHRCAVVISEEHDGRFPSDLDTLLALPGVGPYTARAVLAFAFEHDVAVVDTNVGRVLARLHGGALRPAEAQLLADSLVPKNEGWRWNQAMLDFGAQVCTKRMPNCADCPIVGDCQWRGSGADPAVGSAGVGKTQSRFAGSDREGRGRLVRALRAAPVTVKDAVAILGFSDAERAERVLAGLRYDGMIVERGGLLALP